MRLVEQSSFTKAESNEAGTLVKITVENDTVLCTAELNGRIGVYLDTDSLIDLAKKSSHRRQRFLCALHQGGDLLFSFTSALEIAGTTGDTTAAIRRFLDEVGPYWTPIELNPWKVVRREAAGVFGQAAVSESFMEAYFRERIYDLSGEGCEVLDLSPDSFFRLASVLDWTQEYRDDIRCHAVEIDELLFSCLKRLRENFDKNPSALDREAPSLPFDHRRPATFVLTQLLRKLVLEAKAFQYKKNDGLDFCHAVLASAYGSMITLDKQWKRRVENLPWQDHRPKVYYRPQVDELVDMLEGLATSRGCVAPINGLHEIMN